jgi:hypothetical protein
MGIQNSLKEVSYEYEVGSDTLANGKPELIVRSHVCDEDLLVLDRPRLVTSHSSTQTRDPACQPCSGKSAELCASCSAAYSNRPDGVILSQSQETAERRRHELCDSAIANANARKTLVQPLPVCFELRQTDIDQRQMPSDKTNTVPMPEILRGLR